MSKELQVKMRVIDETTTAMGKLTSNFSGNITRMTFSIKNLIGAYIGLQGVKRIGSFILEGARAANEEERANRKLAFALKDRGIYTEALNKSLADFQTAQMLKTAIDDGEIRDVQRLLIQYGVYGNAINKTTKAIMDYSAAKGVDLVAATNLVLRSLISEKGGMKGLVIGIDGAANSSERLDGIISFMTSHFNGMAEAGATSFDKMQRQLVETQKQMGKAWMPFIVNAEAAFAKVGSIASRYSGKQGWVNLYKDITGASKDEDARQAALETMPNRGAASDIGKGGVNAVGGGGVVGKKVKELSDLEKLHQDRSYMEAKWIDEAFKLQMDTEKKSREIQNDENNQWLEIYRHKEEMAQAHNERMLDISQRRLDQQKQFSMALGDAMTAGIGQGEDGLKVSMKASLMVLVNMLQQKIMAGWISAALDNVFFPGLGAPSLAKMIAISAGFGAVKAGIQSFAMGGFPQGRNSMVRVNENGQEAILNARATANLGRSTIDALNRGSVTNNNTTKPIIVVMGRGDDDIAGAIERATRDRSINWNRILQGVR